MLYECLWRAAGAAIDQTVDTELARDDWFREAERVDDLSSVGSS